MKDGVTGRDVYQHALSYVKDKKPELEKHFVKNIGHGASVFRRSPLHATNIPPQMGLEFRDSAYLLSAKNSRKLKTGMVFNLALGFQDLEEGGKK